MRFVCCVVVALLACGQAAAQPRDQRFFWRSASAKPAVCFEMAEGRLRAPASDGRVRVARYSLVGETLLLEDPHEEGWAAWHPDLYGSARDRKSRERKAERLDRAREEVWFLLRSLPRVERLTPSELTLQARDGRRARFVAARVCDLPES
ncbi:MAG: hypothetical protein QM608_03005 [Caulobacter sp.]